MGEAFRIQDLNTWYQGQYAKYIQYLTIADMDPDIGNQNGLIDTDEEANIALQIAKANEKCGYDLIWILKSRHFQVIEAGQRLSGEAKLKEEFNEELCVVPFGIGGIYTQGSNLYKLVRQMIDAGYLDLALESAQKLTEIYYEAEALHKIANKLIEKGLFGKAVEVIGKINIPKEKTAAICDAVNMLSGSETDKKYLRQLEKMAKTITDPLDKEVVSFCFKEANAKPEELFGIFEEELAFIDAIDDKRVSSDAFTRVIRKMTKAGFIGEAIEAVEKRGISEKTDFISDTAQKMVGAEADKTRKEAWLIGLLGLVASFEDRDEIIIILRDLVFKMDQMGFDRNEINNLFKAASEKFPLLDLSGKGNEFAALETNDEAEARIQNKINMLSTTIVPEAEYQFDEACDPEAIIKEMQICDKVSIDIIRRLAMIVKIVKEINGTNLNENQKESLFGPLLCAFNENLKLAGIAIDEEYLAAFHARTTILFAREMKKAGLAQAKIAGLFKDAWVSIDEEYLWADNGMLTNEIFSAMLELQMVAAAFEALDQIACYRKPRAINMITSKAAGMNLEAGQLKDIFNKALAVAAQISRKDIQAEAYCFIAFNMTKAKFDENEVYAIFEKALESIDKIQTKESSEETADALCSIITGIIALVSDKKRLISLVHRSLDIAKTLIVSDVWFSEIDKIRVSSLIACAMAKAGMVDDAQKIADDMEDSSDCAYYKSQILFAIAYYKSKAGLIDKGTAADLFRSALRLMSRTEGKGVTVDGVVPKMAEAGFNIYEIEALFIDADIIFGQGGNKTLNLSDFKAKLEAFDEIENLFNKSRAICEVAREMAGQGMPVEPVLAVFYKAVEAASAVEDPYFRTHALRWVAMNMAKHGFKDDAVKLFEKARDAAQEINDPARRAETVKVVSSSATNAGLSIEEGIKEN